MKSIDLEVLVASVILNFCENLAELGCPKSEKDSDMWYRNLSSKDQVKVADKLLGIIERDAKRFKTPKSKKKIAK